MLRVSQSQTRAVLLRIVAIATRESGDIAECHPGGICYNKPKLANETRANCVKKRVPMGMMYGVH